MTTRNPNIRFLNNNLLAGATLTFSSALAGFAGSNVVDPKRFKKWIPAGNFTVTAANKNLYINDGADKTVALVEGSYTYATLAAHVEAQLNASSSGWSCTYDLDGETYSFTIACSSDATLRFSQTTDAAWDMLGFTGTEDDARIADDAWVADEPRNHTSEKITIDFGVSRRLRAFCLIGPSGEAFSLSSSAVVTVRANAINSFDDPPLEVTAEVDRRGAFRMLDDIDDTIYRYGEIEIVDRTNPLGPEGLKLSIAYLGDYVELTENDIDAGFGRKLIDPSTVNKAQSGVPYGRRKTKYWAYDGLEITFLSDDQREELETMCEELGQTEPFFICLDPLVGISQSLSEFTRYVRFTSDHSLDHVRYKYYSFGFSVEEVL